MPFSLKVASNLVQVCEIAYSDSVSTVAKLIAGLSVRGSDFVHKREQIRLIKGSTAKVDSECYILENENGDVVVAFRGSEMFNIEGGFKDWVLTDIDKKPVEFPLYEGKAGFLKSKQPFVHQGFWNAYKTIRVKLLEKIIPLMTERNISQQIYVTGHSLGGALALIASIELGQLFKHKVITYTFGAPRIGNSDLAELLEETAGEVYLFANQSDPVPYMPPLGLNVKIGNKRYVHPQHIKYISKNGALKSKLPPAKIASNPHDHRISSYIWEVDSLLLSSRRKSA